MVSKEFDLNVRSAACIFGVGWFFPYCVYTLWAYGIRPFDLDTASFFKDGLVGPLWGLISAYPVEFTMLVQVGFVCLFIIGSRTLSWSLIGFRRTSAVWFFVAIAGIISSYVFSGLLQAIFQEPANESVHIAADGGRSQIYPIGQILTAFMTLGVATAVIEEVAFRGVLYRWFRINMGPFAGIVLSALVFSFFHLRFINPGGLVGLSATLQVMIGGVVLAFLYEKSGSLWPSIYLHGVNNAIGILQVMAPR